MQLFVKIIVLIVLLACGVDVPFAQEKVKPEIIGAYYENDSDSAKKEGLDLLAGKLSENPTALGIIVLSHRKKENVGKRCGYIKTYLRKKGVEAKRLLFIWGGIVPESITILSISDKDDNTLKDIKDYCQSQKKLNDEESQKRPFMAQSESVPKTTLFETIKDDI